MSKRYLILLIMLVVMITTIYIQPLSIQANTNQDLNLLLQSSENWMEKDKKIIVKFGDFYQSYANKNKLEEIGLQLEEHFRLQSGELSEDKAHRSVYQASLNLNEEGIKISLRLLAMEEQNTHYLTILLEAKDATFISVLEKHKEWIEKRLMSLGLSDEAQIMIQGTLLPSISPADKQWWTNIHNALQLSELDRYQDHKTLSVSFYSSKLNNKIQSGSQAMNLQIAFHQDSLSNRWRLTLGTPIITIEY